MESAVCDTLTCMHACLQCSISWKKLSVQLALAT